MATPLTDPHLPFRSSPSLDSSVISSSQAGAMDNAKESIKIRGTLYIPSYPSPYLSLSSPHSSNLSQFVQSWTDPLALALLADEDRESRFGSVFSVSGPVVIA